MASVIFSIVDGEGDLSVSGLDSLQAAHVQWLAGRLEVGDKVRFRVAEADRISDIRKRRFKDRKKLKEEYLRLKKKLTEKGLL